MDFAFFHAAALNNRKKRLSSKVVEFEGTKRRRRRRRSQKRVVVVKPDSKLAFIEKIPDDLLMAILLKLPAKTLTSLILVSKLWYSLIFSRHFTNLFLASPSSSKPLRSIVSIVGAEDRFKHVYLSSSSSPKRYYEDTNKLVCRLDQVLDIPGMEGYFVNALRALLCVILDRRVRICNLTTNQCVDLPIIKSQLLAEPNSYISTFFGYNPVHDEYKVLNIVSVRSKEDKTMRSEHQVLVLGPKASWRNTKGHIYPHRPDSIGILIKGVFYYRVRLDKNKPAIMSFDFNSEDFKLIELPIETGNNRWNTWCSTIMNFKDKVAVFDYSDNNFVTSSSVSIDFWVMEDVKKMEWSKNTMIVPLYQMGFVNRQWFFMQGTGRCNEVVLVNPIICTGIPIPYLYFDLVDNKITKIFKICLPGNLMHLWGKGCETSFWEDNVENLMFLEI